MEFSPVVKLKAEYNDGSVRDRKLLNAGRPCSPADEG